MEPLQEKQTMGLETLSPLPAAAPDYLGLQRTH